MRYFIYILAILALIAINIGLFNNLKLAWQIHNLLFLFVVCASLLKKDFDFFFIGLVGGLFLDFYSPNFFGGFTLAFIVTGMIIYLFIRTFAVSDLNWRTLGFIF